MTNSDLKGHKKVLRTLFKEKRSALSIDQKAQFSDRIAESLLASPMVSSANVICSYASFGDEVATHALNDALLAMNKIVLLPRIVGQHSMEMIRISNDTEYDVNPFGMKEPIGNPYILHNDASFLCILPLLAFDAQGHRLGYGGGFYDAFLLGYPHVSTIGLAFSCQYSDHTLPTEQHDCSLDWIIDECGLHHSIKKPA